MFPSWNPNLETVGLEKPLCIHIGLPCQFEDMQYTGNLHGLFLLSAQCILGQAPAPPSMTLNGIKRVGENGRMNVSFNVVGLYFAINWPVDRLNN